VHYESLARALGKVLRTCSYGRSPGSGDKTYSVAGSAYLETFGGKTLEYSRRLDRAAKSGEDV
jgi:hypothetical protein